MIDNTHIDKCGEIEDIVYNLHANVLTYNGKKIGKYILSDYAPDDMK